MAGAGIAGATLLAFFPTSAGASSDSMTAVFTLTGVNPDNCNVNLGGSDAYLKPGQDLSVKSNIASVLGISLGSFDGTLKIDGKSYDVTSSAKDIGTLSKGDHDWKFTATKTVGLPPLAQVTTVADYSGTFHVTSDKTSCGIAIQVPTTHVSASVTNLPTVTASIPGVKGPTIPVPSVSLPKLPLPTSSLPSLPLPGVGGSSGGGSTGGTGSATLPVPARVVPGGGNLGQTGGGSTSGGGAVGQTQPSSQAIGGSTGGDLVPATSNESKVSAAPALEQPSTGKHKAIDLAASKANSTGQFSVILAIIAIVALSIVAATYARLYVLKRETPAA